jgi:NADPH-dependent glutamate synthase beta subunit-like oxidoreductase/Pyruvate/2-oxoacid:ferredoxin oxidoreductase delta subunit
VFSLRNPFPAITGRVCPHDCEVACNRAVHGSAVSIRALERHLGDRAAHLPHRKPDEETGRRIAVVGSGPAGLAAAYYLRRAGHEVTVLERRHSPGGMLRHGIPAYRLPDRLIDAEVERLEAMGITFRIGTTLGDHVTVADLAGEHDAVFVATGAWRARSMGIDGEELELLESGLDFLDGVASGTAPLPGRHCAVVGGGNTAMDVARVLRRLGAAVTVLYRRTEAEMPAVREEIEQAKADGVGFRFLTLPRSAAQEGDRRVLLEVETMVLGLPDTSGRPQPEPTGEVETLRFDAVFSAIGEQADVGPFPSGMLGADGWLDVGPGGTTRDDKVFVGGDLTTGPATVIEAIAAGRRGAATIQSRLDDSGNIPDWAVFEESSAVVGAEEVNPAYLPRRPRVEDPRIPGSGTFEEETETISATAALAEIERCYSCGHCNACGTCFIFCPDVAIRWDDGPVFDYDVCKGCGICTTECPGQALAFVVEGTAR